MQKFTSVLFVCLGNICRSPLAEAIFRHLVTEAGQSKRFLIESCGTGGWHAGEGAHKDSCWVADINGISLANHRARQLTKSDFQRFELIVAMDRSNLQDIKKLSGRSAARLICLREYDPLEEGLDVPDPYYGGRDGFEVVFAMIYRSCEQLLSEIIQTNKI